MLTVRDAQLFLHDTAKWRKVNCLRKNGVRTRVEGVLFWVAGCRCYGSRYFSGRLLSRPVEEAEGGNWEVAVANATLECASWGHDRAAAWV